MRKLPLRDKAQGSKGRLSKAVQLPAPTKGWMVGENLAEAPPGTAYVLQNCFPRSDYVRIRRGSQAYATGMPNNTVATIMPWNNGTTSKMFAVCGGNIYDVSSTGAVGSASYSGLSWNYLQYVQFQGLGGSYLVACNGHDSVLQWNGSAWSVPAITGLTGQIFSNVSVFKNRLYFVENNSLNIWYLPVNAIAGAATVFPMQGVFKYGGYIVASGTWAIDSTSGIYEAFVAVSSEGEVVMYDGSDPSTWTLKGTYKVAKPLGTNCLQKAGGDLMVMTQDGIISMSQIQQLDQIALQNIALTQPIQPAWRDAVAARIGLLGWQITMWPTESMAVINLPKTSDTDKTQYVVNARTGAWASYVGWDANCFAVYNNNLYFGSSDGRVMQGEIGSADDGANYNAIIFYSFSSINGDVTHKQMRMIHPYCTNNMGYTLDVKVNVDFDISLPNAPTASVPPAGGPVWNTSQWDKVNWTGALQTQNYWQTVSGFGTLFAPILQITLSTASSFADIRLMRTDVLFEEAEIIA